MQALDTRHPAVRDVNAPHEPDPSDASLPHRARPKVCVFTSVHRADDHRLRKESRSLVSAGYDLVMVAPHERDETIDNYRVRAIPRPLTRPERMTRTAWSAYSAARREQAAIYHFHDPELLPLALLLKMQGKRVIYDAHEDVPRDIMLKTYIPKLPRWLLAQFARVAEKGSAMLLDGVVVASDHMIRGFRAARRVISVRNFPDLARFQAQQRRANSPEFRIIYIGSLAAVRGVRKLVEALPHVRPDLNVRLSLYGELDPPGFFEELQKLPGWQYVDFGGSLDHNDVPQALASAHVGMACLQPTETYISAIPTKLYEYLAAGLPLIASNFPLYRAIVEKHRCGLCVDPTDPVAIAHAIEQLADHPEQREELGRRGRALSGAYAWAGEAGKLLDLYADVLSRAV